VPAPERILLVADRVVDGTGRPALERAFVLVEGGRIAAVGPPGDRDGEAPPASHRLTFPGCTILPGLVDSHVHLTFSAGPVPLKQLQDDSDARLAMTGVANARAALLAGVTTVRDLGSRGRITLDLRDAIAASGVPGPRVLASGRPITSPGGHCHFLGGVARGVRAVSDLATELMDQGADAIKIMGTGGNMTEGSDPLQAQFSSGRSSASPRMTWPPGWGSAGRPSARHSACSPPRT
jgi:imidazolonepropionase-like amidohydrolase